MQLLQGLQGQQEVSSKEVLGELCTLPLWKPPRLQEKSLEATASSGRAGRELAGRFWREGVEYRSVEFEEARIQA